MRTRWQGKWALITGASAGIGVSLARILAREGCHLILTARRRDRLEALQAELAATGVTVEVIAEDLGRPEGARALFAEVTRLGHTVDLLINNAGFGLDGRFAGADWDRQEGMIRLDVLAPAELTRLFLPGMLERKAGDILLIASIAAFLPVPFMATYAACKAYLRSFGESLGHELRGTGVRVTVLSPGGTETEFQAVAGMPPTKLTKLGMMPADKVAAIALAAMARGRRSVIAGVMNKIMMWLATRMLPLGIRLRAAESFQKAAGGGRK